MQSEKTEADRIVELIVDGDIDVGTHYSQVVNDEEYDIIIPESVGIKEDGGKKQRDVDTLSREEMFALGYASGLR